VTGSAVFWAGDEDFATRGSLRGTQRCDVAIVGAGLTGLSTALELLELAPQRRVVVIEADHVAAGASGRGTGLLGTRIGPPLRVARRRFGDEVARAAYLWSVGAVGHVLDIVDRYGISCDLVPGSQLIAADDEKGAQAQRHEADAARALGLVISYVDRGSLPALAAAAGYVSGLRYAPAATLDPAALTRELARIGERRGLTIFERSPVRGIKRGSPAVVITDRGQIAADRVVVAINAFGAISGAPSGVLGLKVQAGVTEKLPPEVLAAVEALGAEPLIGHREASPYFRLTADGRIVVGGGAVRRGTHGSVAPAPATLRAAVRRLSPALAEVEMESTWSGPIGLTRDGLPVVGQHPDDPRLYHAGGCNGHGLAVSVHNGALLARWLAFGQPKQPSPALPWIRPKAPWLPRGRLVDSLLDRYLAHITAASGRSGPSEPPDRIAVPQSRTTDGGRP